MKCLVDAQLPRRLARWLSESGCDALHTLDLPLGNVTPDSEISCFADNQSRIVVTKYADFVQSFLISGTPQRLLLVSTGNLDNIRLTGIFHANLPALREAFNTHRFVEITQTSLIVHE